VIGLRSDAPNQSCCGCIDWTDRLPDRRPLGSPLGVDVKSRLHERSREIRREDQLTAISTSCCLGDHERLRGEICDATPPFGKLSISSHFERSRLASPDEVNRAEGENDLGGGPPECADAVKNERVLIGPGACRVTLDFQPWLQVQGTYFSLLECVAMTWRVAVDGCACVASLAPSWPCSRHEALSLDSRRECCSTKLASDQHKRSCRTFDTRPSRERLTDPGKASSTSLTRENSSPRLPPPIGDRLCEQPEETTYPGYC